MGLTPHEYYCMSPLEFYYASKGYMDRYYKKWEQTRVIAYTTASTVPSKKRLPKMQTWMPLPNDEASYEQADIKSMFEHLKEKIKQNGYKRTTGKDNGGHIGPSKETGSGETTE